MSASDESRVLVIYTGGTIGMLVGPQGYRNEPNYLYETLRCQSLFHDPHEDSLFSHSASVEGYRKWTPAESNPNPIGRVPYLKVKSPRPLQIPHSTTGSGLGESIQSADIYESNLPSLITPRSSLQGNRGKRIRYVILEWNPLLDSSNIRTADWIRIATEIELNYATFDAFVVLHGTDTMCYTSSALSFMLEHLGKTVILTGAQIPISQLRSDAIDNLLGSLTIAGHYIIPECSIFFNHNLFRGNRVSKISSSDFNAFNSPNFPPLVNVGIDIVVHWDTVLRQTSNRRFRAHKGMDSSIATLRLFPGIPAAVVRTFLLPPTRGVVLETFGSGNAPQDEDLLNALREGCDRGVVIVAISQCAKGSVSDAYETGRTLLQAGVIPGGDMTPECALTKLAYLLSKPELTIADIRKLIGSPLRGELTIYNPQTGTNDGELDGIRDLLGHAVRISTKVTVPSEVSNQHTADAAAPWLWTASESAKIEAALLPFLVHLAVSKNDVRGLKFCFDLEDKWNSGSGRHGHGSIIGGVANCIEPTLGMSPLHVAALNGSTESLTMLLDAGALVHLRDDLGHTPLYYAARRGQANAVELLRAAGANFGGADLEGFVDLEVTKARETRKNDLVHLWERAGSLAFLE